MLVLMDKGTCTQDGCDRVLHENGLCRMHYMRQWRGATPEQMAAPPRGAPLLATACKHTDRPQYGGQGLCKPCYQTKWMREHPEANSGNTWAKNHPEQHQVLKRRATLKKRHGITEKLFEEMWRAQGGKCGNPRCDAVFPLVVPDYRIGLQVDHDHRTGRIRKLLCASCNRTLGDIDDDAERLAGLIEYLGSELTV